MQLTAVLMAGWSSTTGAVGSVVSTGWSGVHLLFYTWFSYVLTCCVTHHTCNGPAVSYTCSWTCCVTHLLSWTCCITCMLMDLLCHSSRTHSLAPCQIVLCHAAHMLDYVFGFVLTSCVIHHTSHTCSHARCQAGPLNGVHQLCGVVHRMNPPKPAQTSMRMRGRRMRQVRLGLRQVGLVGLGLV